MADTTRLCSQHGTVVEPFSSGRFLCPAKSGPNGHQKHVVTIEETRGAGSPPTPAPRPAARSLLAKNTTVVRWKGSDSAKRVLWLHAIFARRKSGDMYLLRWAILTGKKQQQGVWSTKPDEQAARLEFQAQVARSQAGGWTEAELGVGGFRTILKPVPAGEKRARG